VTSLASEGPSNLCIGFEFQVTEPIVVTSLGFFDQMGDGFESGTAVEVGIFDASSMASEGSVMVLTGDPLDANNFRFSSISFSLDVGTYRICGTSGESNIAKYGSIPTLNFGGAGSNPVSFVQSVACKNDFRCRFFYFFLYFSLLPLAASSSFGFPTVATDATANAFIGPNFAYYSFINPQE
jgi:hypothetical protein